uniref:Uncharacterized protein n=1 Tax=Rhizophora mucronata TaxID=61149 RepID=A0A2P2R429_RHIMU
MHNHQTIDQLTQNCEFDIQSLPCK